MQIYMPMEKFPHMILSMYNMIKGKYFLVDNISNFK